MPGKGRDTCIGDIAATQMPPSDLPEACRLKNEKGAFSLFGFRNPIFHRATYSVN